MDWVVGWLTAIISLGAAPVVDISVQPVQATVAVGLPVEVVLSVANRGDEAIMGWWRPTPNWPHWTVEYARDGEAWRTFGTGHEADWRDTETRFKHPEGWPLAAGSVAQTRLGLHYDHTAREYITARPARLSLRIRRTVPSGSTYEAATDVVVVAPDERRAEYSRLWMQPAVATAVQGYRFEEGWNEGAAVLREVARQPDAEEYAMCADRWLRLRAGADGLFWQDQRLDRMAAVGGLLSPVEVLQRLSEATGIAFACDAAVAARRIDWASGTRPVRAIMHTLESSAVATEDLSTLVMDRWFATPQGGYELKRVQNAYVPLWTK